MAKASGMFIDDRAIIEAYLWALDKHRNNSERIFRVLTDDDVSDIYEVRAELGRRWAPVKLERSMLYHDWRHQELDKMQFEFAWSDETRNLYGSMISIIWNWSEYGQSADCKERLKVLYPGASLFLQFLKKFQPKLTVGTSHKAVAL